ncbi:MFS transporter [Shimazuella alba]|uniref:MFS transporter n=1 Tax=Shimazuella alba TaxID=2690964 RepID=A0A6I4VW66_9BACL|nr:MFS transporter [Shimazuella alba]MXQ55767.1 MFS transporter [Shimazuella alba]
MNFWQFVHMNKLFGQYITAFSLWQLTKWMVITTIPLFLNSRYGLGTEFVFSMTIQILPSIILGPTIGMWIDGWGAKHIVTLDMLIYSILIAILPFTSELWQVQLLMISIGISQAIGTPASLTLRTSVIGRGYEIQGNSLIMGIERLSRICGPLVGGICVSLFSYTYSNLIYSTLGFLSLALFVGLSIKDEQKSESDNQNWWDNLRNMLPDLWRLFRRDSIVLAFSISAIGYSAMSGILKIYLLKLADLFGDIEQYWGFFLAAQGTGAFIGSLVCSWFLARLTPKLPLTKIYLLFVVGESLFLIVLTFPIHVYGKLIVLMVASMLEIFCTIIYFTVIQIRVPREKQGSLNSVTLALMDAFYAIGFTFIGSFIRYISPEGILWIGISSITIPLVLFIQIQKNKTDIFMNRGGKNRWK